MNSYTVPLNSQEKRHAFYQGEFKWFMVEVTRKYAQSLKDIGVFRVGGGVHPLCSAGALLHCLERLLRICTIVHTIRP